MNKEINALTNEPNPELLLSGIQDLRTSWHKDRMNNAFLTAPCKLYGTGWEGLSSHLTPEGSGQKQEEKQEGHHSTPTELRACESTRWPYSSADTQPPLCPPPYVNLLMLWSLVVLSLAKTHRSVYYDRISNIHESDETITMNPHKLVT